MQHIYYSIALLVLYGDLIKRVLPASISLLVLYALSAVILLAIFSKRSGRKIPVSLEGKAVFYSATMLISLYWLQLMTSFFAPFLEGLMHTMYMVIPLLYIVVVQRFCPQFNLVTLGKIFLVLMIPINFIGIVQYYFNPNFVISTVYSGELGGIILRNYLDGGYFSRYPSLFSSADRYSAMALMQLYFTFVVLKGSCSVSNKGKLWLILNLVSSVAALFIAGARSRILIAFFACGLMAFTFVMGVISSSEYRRKMKIINKLFPLLAVVVLVAGLAVMIDENEEKLSIPVAGFLIQSIEKGDIDQRLGQAVLISELSENITIFGQGLGSIGNGKPGEFGIRSMWIESGYFWGIFMLCAFFGLIAAISINGWRSFVAMEALSVSIYTIPVLLLIFALLAGLTSAFEFSTGLLLGCSIAVITRTSRNITGSVQLPASSRMGEY